MANDEVKKQREAFIKQGIDSSRLAIAEVRDFYNTSTVRPYITVETYAFNPLI